MKGESLVRVAADKALRAEDIFPSASGKTCHPVMGPATDGKGISTMSGGPKVFFAHLREMTERFDPSYFLPEYRDYATRLKSCGMPVLRLSQWIDSIDSGMGEYDLSDKMGWRYLNVNNIVPGSIDDRGCGYILTPPDLGNVNVIKRGDIVTGRVGTIGVFVKYADDMPAYISDNVFRIRLKDCNPDYVLAVLNSSIAQKQLERAAKGSLQRVVNKKTIRDLQIPVPPPDVQKRIVEELDAAYAAKRNADEKAAQLLASIDDIVLSELGIPPLPPQDDSLAARMFFVPARQLAEKTLAPSHYFECLDFSASRFPCRRFSDVVAIDPAETNSGASGRCSFVPMDAVSAEYGRIEHFETVEADRTNGYSCFRNGDVIWAKITPCMENGKSAVVESSDTGLLFGSTEFMVFRPRSNEIDPRYLHYLLRLRRLRQVAARHFTGSSGHQRVTGAFFAGLEIPVPPLPAQHAIAAKAMAAIKEAKQRRTDASLALETARKKIEAELIG